jgi:hypothetical protein
VLRDSALTPGLIPRFTDAAALRHRAQDRNARIRMEDQDEINARLTVLQSEHRDLDTVIARLSSQAPTDQLQLQRLKKRKLKLKDEIAWLESRLLPDIIA